MNYGQDCLQYDLEALDIYSKKWDMIFNAEKCYVLSMFRRGAGLNRKYTVNGQILQSVIHHPYLGVKLQGDLKWDKHIESIVNKANQALGFLYRNIYMCPKEVKMSAYHSLVCPHLEYASAAWDPHMVKDVTRLELVQQKAARFETGNKEREEPCMIRLLQE